MTDDLFDALPVSSGGGDEYDSSAIEVLEGLEPVRRRPGMYIGGTDDRALHHLAAEVLDNAMDEAVAGHASRIEVTLEAGPDGSAGRLTIADNGRGMPVDEHPKFPGKSSLEVIMTMLHSGGKFSGKAYATSGGLHGVGVSVVNALSSDVRVEVARGRELYVQCNSRAACRRASWSTQARRRTGVAPRSASCPMHADFWRTASSAPSGCSSSRARRRTCSPASRSAGSALPPSLPTRCRPKRCSSSPAAWPITSPSR